MRVLALLTAYPPTHCAGSEVMVHALLRPLVARGHTVDVVLTRDRGNPYDLDGVHVHPRIDRRDPLRHSATADVIIGHLENAPRATALGHVNMVPSVQVCHNTNRHTDSYVRAGADLFVFNSEHMAARYRSHRARSIIVRPPVDPIEYETTPGDRVTLVNLCQDKGAETFYALAERFPSAPFLGVEGAYGAQIHDILPNVEIIPHVPADRMRDEVYARTRVLLMPSAHESWGRAGVEAMCSGIPVIAAPTDGLREALGDAGHFADPDDLDAWEAHLRLLLDGRRWRAASRKAKTRARELDPAPDLARWVTEIETLGEVGRRARLARDCRRSSSPARA